MVQSLSLSGIPSRDFFLKILLIDYLQKCRAYFRSSPFSCLNSLTQFYLLGMSLFAPELPPTGHHSIRKLWPWPLTTSWNPLGRCKEHCHLGPIPRESDVLVWGAALVFNAPQVIGLQRESWEPLDYRHTQAQTQMPEAVQQVLRQGLWWTQELKVHPEGISAPQLEAATVMQEGGPSTVKCRVVYVFGF